MSMSVALWSEYYAVCLRWLAGRSKDAPRSHRLLAVAIIGEGGSSTQAAGRRS